MSMIFYQYIGSLINNILLKMNSQTDDGGLFKGTNYPIKYSNVCASDLIQISTHA